MMNKKRDALVSLSLMWNKFENVYIHRYEPEKMK